MLINDVVVATTKVRIFKQITTYAVSQQANPLLLLLPQRYVFSSKSQPFPALLWYLCVVVATTKVRIFKQITTIHKVALFCQRLLLLPQRYVFSSKSQRGCDNLQPIKSCCCYHKGTYFQANHNTSAEVNPLTLVVVATTKVRIFKQITTTACHLQQVYQLLLLPQRYVFSSKSQLGRIPQIEVLGCCCYHKGTYFQANHN